MKINLLKSALLAVIVIATSCNSSSKKAQNDGLSGEINIDGSSTVYPITEAIAEEFRMVEPDVKVTVGVSGTGGGFKKFYRGETQINDASRTIKEEEIIKCNENNITYTEFEVAYDGLAVIANPENDWLDSINVDELKKLWEPAAQGVIMKWSQIRKGWPDEEIHLYGPGVASGTYDYFTEAIVGESGASRGDFTASEDDNVLVQGIANDKYALGFFGLAYFEENKEKLKLVAVDNGDGAVKPTLETVSEGTYAPLSRPIFIYVNNDFLMKEPVKTFVTFYLTEAPGLVEEVGYIPLPDELYKQQLSLIK